MNKVRLSTKDEKLRVGGKFSSSKKVNKLSNLKIVRNPDVPEELQNKKIDEINEWQHGRRIVELGLLADQLEHCVDCSYQLSLKNITDETKQGLGSILYIQCNNCKTSNKLYTGKRHSAKEAGDGPPSCFDINTKLAAAMINAGVGEQQLNNILAVLNLPTLSHKSLKQREREIGRTLESYAEESCDKAIEEEMKCINKLNETKSKYVEPQVSSDGGWQRRGTGCNNNSLSGHVTMVGKYSKKCLSYSNAKKQCRTCDFAKRNGKVARIHSCRKNLTGSSKGMEPFLTLQSLKKLQQKGFDVKKITMDDDSTTFVRASNVISDLQKFSDKNHVIRNMTNELYKLKNKHKTSFKVINHFKKCFSYAVSQNENNPAEIQRNISAIVPHSYGDHTKCSLLWCKYQQDSTSYKHKSLPFGKDLSDKELRKDLDLLFDKYTSDVMSNKLASMQCSNTNENLNYMISRKAPKAQHFSGSESLALRIAAAVSQKNNGHSYLLQVNEHHGLSPGKFTQQRLDVLDRQKVRRALFRNSVSYKKRRLHLKEIRKCHSMIQETTEGTTYEKNIDTFDVENDTIEEIPTSLQEPRNNMDVDENLCSKIIFDLETTGLGTDSDIIQIAAKNYEHDDSFNIYVYPSKCFISKKVTQITGLEIHGKTMYRNLEQVQAVSICEALENFSLWLSKYEPAILLAHNAPFDARILVNSCSRLKKDCLLDRVAGFADTLPMFKTVFPNRGRSKYNLTALVTDLLGYNYDAHNASADVSVLGELYRLVEKCQNIKDHVFTVEKVMFNITRLKNEKQNLASYQNMIKKGIISNLKAKCLSGKGFSARHVKLVFNRAGVDGLESFFKGKVTKPFELSYKLSEFFNTG